MRKISIVIFMVLLPVTLILNAAYYCSFDINFYHEKYVEYGIDKDVKMDMSELINATNKMLDYILSKSDDISFSAIVNNKEQVFFNKKERTHLKDVKGLIKKGLEIRMFCIIGLILSSFYIIYRDRKKIFIYTIMSLGITSLVVGIFVVLIVLDFSKWFDYFHMALFTNKLWLMNVEKDIIINMFPLEFFESIAIKIMKFYIAEMGVVLTLTGTLSYVKLNKNHKNVSII